MGHDGSLKSFTDLREVLYDGLKPVYQTQSQNFNSGFKRDTVAQC